MTDQSDLYDAARWRAVDAYIEQLYIDDDAVAARVLERQREAGLPDIAVSPAQGKLLEVLARAIGARRALEFGTLGGYSTLWLARVVPDGGKVVSFELEPRHAEVALASLAEAGVADKVEIRIGPAIDNLHTLDGDEPYDLVFIDADKPSNLAYYEAAMTRVHSGSIVVVDNVVRGGDIVYPDSPDDRVRGSRAVVERVASDERISATVLQTVGAKDYDGMIVGTVL
jgi:predicted O-methyltransferase YrrM